MDGYRRRRWDLLMPFVFATPRQHLFGAVRAHLQSGYLIPANKISSIPDDVMGRAGMGSWVGTNGGRAERGRVDKEYSVEYPGRVYYGAPPGNISSIPGR